MFFDGKNVTGKLFRVKQLALSRVSPKTQTSIGLLPTILNEGIYSPINTMLQVGGNFFGLHIDKQGPLLGELPRYADIMVDFGDDEDDERVGTTSRLAGLLYTYHRGEKKKPKSLKNFRLQKVDRDKRAYTFLYAYNGGPSSTLGFGQTRLYLSTDRNNVPVVLPNIKGNYYYNLNSEDQNLFKPLSGYTSRLELLYTREYTQNKWENTTYFETFTSLFNIGTGNIFDNPLITLSSKNNQYYYQGFDRNTFKGPEGQVEEKLLNLFNTGYTDIVKWNRTSNFDAGNSIFNLATKNIGDAPIRTRYIELNGFSSEEAFFTNTEGELVDPNTYLNNGATFRLQFLYNRQYNTTSWRDDTRFFEGRGFFNLATKNDNITPIRTINSNIYGNLTTAQVNSLGINIWRYANTYQPILGTATVTNTENPKYLSTLNNLYIIPKDAAGNTITSFNWHGKSNKFATGPHGNTPLRSGVERTENGRQWGIYDLQALNTEEVRGMFAPNLKNAIELNDASIPTSRPELANDFRKRISTYEKIGLDYNAGSTRIERRVNLGDPGGESSKIAYKSGVKRNYSSNKLTVVNTWGTSGTGEAAQWKDPNSNAYRKAVDKINMIPVYTGTGTLPGSTIPKNDLVNFAIGVNINSSGNFAFNWLHFRAHLNDISDTYSSDWNSTQYVGRTDKFYNYGGGFERNISTSFIVAAQSKAELIPMYKKLNYLASAIAGDYTSKGYMAGNMMKLAIGSYIHMVPGFLKGITYTMKQGYPWEIGISGFYKADGTTWIDDSVKELCHYIEVSGFDFTVIHEFLPRVANDNPMNTNRRFISLRNATGTNWSYSGDATGIDDTLSGAELEAEKADDFAVEGSHNKEPEGGIFSNPQDILDSPVLKRTTGKESFENIQSIDLDGEGLKDYLITYDTTGKAFGQVVSGGETSEEKIDLSSYQESDSLGGVVTSTEVQEAEEAFTYQEFKTKYQPLGAEE